MAVMIALLATPAVQAAQHQAEAEMIADATDRLEQAFDEESRKFATASNTTLQHASKLPESCAEEVSRFCPKSLLEGMKCLETNRHRLAPACYVDLVRQIPYECKESIPNFCHGHREHTLVCLGDKIDKLQGRCQQLVRAGVLGRVQQKDHKAAQAVLMAAAAELAALKHKTEEAHRQTQARIAARANEKAHRTFGHNVVSHRGGYFSLSKVGSSPSSGHEDAPSHPGLLSIGPYAVMMVCCAMVLAFFLRGSKARLQSPEKRALLPESEAVKGFDACQPA
eukprot:TRINITY_DN110733_c0_g1_i1.p1 TRINITY_DN110733_c0_g1~~TRINITY_DN110733_c0_g1_i1.p1  ORF type:complete len:320 (+),score=70.20 TRINITY_DN110733_c0_g1_i1:118-960(+)